MKYYWFLALPLLPGCLLLSGLVSAECGDGFIDQGEDCDSSLKNGDNGNRCNIVCNQEEASFSVEDINGNHIQRARFAIFSTSISTSDLDGDGVLDFEVSSLTITLSDQEDLCAQLTADPTVLTTKSDIEAIRVSVIKEDDLGKGGFFSGQSLASNSSLIDVFFTPTPGFVFINSVVTARRGGVFAINADDVLFSAVNSADLEISSISDTSLEASFSSSLLFDISALAAIDADQNDDGTLDSTAIQKSIEAAVHSASLCVLP